MSVDRSDRRLRVCIVARVAPAHGIGGMQDHTRDLARGLAAHGHDVLVLSARHPAGVREEIEDGVTWRYLDAAGASFAEQDWLRASYAAFATEDACAPFDVVHGEGSSALELVRRGVQQHRPCVVMFHGNFLGLVKASLARQLAAHRPAPVLREQRGLVDLTRRHFARGNWRVFRACEAIVPSRQQLSDTCRSHLLEPSRVHVVPNGVDPAAFRPRPRTEARAALGLDGGFVFACVGRLNREKGTHHALEALARLGPEAPDARLAVVGDGEERTALEDLAARLGIAERVVFAGARPPAAVPQWLAAADAFLFPTERDEAAPMVLPQAMACALPVIASARGGIPEVIDRPGVNGLLVRPAACDDLTDAMRALYRDPVRAEAIGRAALERVRARYTLDHMVEGTLAVYRAARERLAAAA